MTSNVDSLESTLIKGAHVSLQSLIKLQYIARSLPSLPNAKIQSSQFGGHVSKLKGRGIEFDEVREYQMGDDIKRMDWRITARTGKPHIKLFHDERDRPVYLLVDDRANMQFGTKTAFKSVIASSLASIFAWSTVQHGDKLGAVIADGADSIEIRPRMRHFGVLPLLNILADDNKQHGNGPLVDALVKLRQVAKPGSLIIIISDFYNIGQEFEEHLSRLKLHNDIIGCFIYDIFEKTPPSGGDYQITDGKSGFTMNTRSSTFTLKYKKIFQDRFTKIEKIFNRWNIPMIQFATNESVFSNLQKSFRGVKR